MSSPVQFLTTIVGGTALVLGIWGAMPGANTGIAQPRAEQSTQRQQQLLTNATIDRLRNQVTVQLQQQPLQAANIDDVLIPDDLLYTGATSLAQMVFNDNTLIRVGQNSTFQFLPEARQIQLEEGVMMMVTPPGAGGAEIVTPTAIAGVQGSLLTVSTRERDGKEQVLALTFTSPATISSPDGDEIATLDIGQVILLEDGVPIAISNFDRCNTLNTGQLYAGLAPGDDPTQEADLAGAQDSLQMEQDILVQQGVCEQPEIAVLTEPRDLEIPEFGEPIPDDPNPPIEVDRRPRTPDYPQEDPRTPAYNPSYQPDSDPACLANQC